MRLFLLALLGAYGFVVCFAKKDSFVAGVFEHRYAHDDTQNPREQLMANIKVFKKAAEVASQKKVDILVFNEGGLSSYELYDDGKDVLRQYSEHVPDPTKVKTNPCEEKVNYKDRQVLYSLSCMAKQHRMYIVANMIDIQPCVVSETCDKNSVDGCTAECPDDGVFMYNTNVAFDRKGTLIARYHKMHPYFETLNTPKVTEHVTFDTEFGVFGTIICFDSVWKESIDLVEKHGVEHLIFTTFWLEDIVPFSTNEWQQSWALANKVNLLASNGHYSKWGTQGSGIYSKELGALRYSFNPDGKSKLLVARVPRNVTPETKVPTNRNDVIIIDGDDVYESRDEGQNLPKYCLDKVLGPAKDTYSDLRCSKSQTQRSSLKKLDDATGTVEVCQNEFCCSATYVAKSMAEDYYIAVYSGLNDVRDYYKWGEETCLLVRCDPLDGKPCIALTTESNTVFKYVELRAKFTTKYVYPAVSNSKHRLSPISNWQVREEDSETVLEYHTFNDPLLRMGMIGRVYEKDLPWIPIYGY